MFLEDLFAFLAQHMQKLCIEQYLVDITSSEAFFTNMHLIDRHAKSLPSPAALIDEYTKSLRNPAAPKLEVKSSTILLLC